MNNLAFARDFRALLTKHGLQLLKDEDGMFIREGDEETDAEDFFFEFADEAESEVEEEEEEEEEDDDTETEIPF